MNQTTEQTMSPLVTIIMIPRERFGSTPEAVASLYANTRMPFRLIYVDSNSPERYAAPLRKLATEHGFEVLRTSRYLKPTQVRNIGARASNTKYIAFVDNDVAFAPGWLEKLVDCAEETGAAVVGPLACQFEPLHEIIHAAGGQIMAPDELARFMETSDESLRGANGTAGFRIEEEIFLQERPVAEELSNMTRGETGFVEFHCCLVRKDILARIGYLDERLSTKEHLDFCLSIQRAGGKIYLEPNSIITYFAFAGERMFELSELPFYLLRWSSGWHLESLEHFRRKWHLDNDDYFAKRAAISYWRRELAVRELVAQMVPRWLGTLPVKALARALMPIETIISRTMAARHARYKSEAAPVEAAAPSTG